MTSNHTDPEGTISDVEATPEVKPPVSVIRATTPAPVPHRLVIVRIPIDIQEFEAAGVMSVYASLPVMCTWDQRWNSLQAIARYLSAFSWSPSSSAAIQAECQEILGSCKGSQEASSIHPEEQQQALRSAIELFGATGFLEDRNLG